MSNSPELLSSLEAAAARTHAAISALVPELEWGACHGDLHEGNVHIDESATLWLFDFDCGGPGYRAYDLAVYWWSQASNKGKTPEQEVAAWTAFLNGYTAIRPLSEADERATRHFVAARAIWFMGLYVQLAEVFGTTTVSERFFQRGLDFITGWEARQEIPALLS